MITEWKKKAGNFVEAHETPCTLLLLFVALILLCVAVYGKPHHKAMALIYIVM